MFTSEKPPSEAVSSQARAARTAAQAAPDRADSWRDEVRRRSEQGRY